MPAKSVPRAVAIVAVDPGRTTGVARGVFPVASVHSIEEAFRSGIHCETYECDGPIKGQAQEIVEEASDWFAALHLFASFPIPWLHFVVEDFALRQRSADLAPVELTNQIEALWNWDGFEIEKQQPATAKGYATNERLRRWGAWVVGSDHRRDAQRHLLARLSKEIE